MEHTIFKRLNHYFQKKHKVQKASQTAPLMVSGYQGRPVWTPRRYDALTEEGYHKNVIVYRCVNIVARAVASVPWLLRTHHDNGDEKEIYHHPLLELMNTPSPTQGGAAFIEAMVSYLLLSGNSYVEAVFNSIGKPVELYPLRPDRMTVVPGDTGEIIAYDYRVQGQSKRIEVQPNTVSPILHLKMWHC